MSAQHAHRAKDSTSALPSSCRQLALILRTLGTLPAAPAGLEATCTQPGRSYYSLPRAEAASAATMTRSRSSRASLRRTRSSGPVPSDPASEAVAEELLAAGKTWAANDPLEIARQLKRQRRSASADPEGPPAAGAAAAAAAAGASVAAAAPAPEQPDAAAAAAGQGQEQAAALLQETWVQCELCQKWRRLAPGHKVGLFIDVRLPVGFVFAVCCWATEIPKPDGHLPHQPHLCSS